MALLFRRNLLTISGFGFASSLISLLTGHLQAQAQQSKTGDDYTSIINAVNGIAIFADLRDWNRCRQSFTDQVEFDYTSLMGGKPTAIAADKQMQQWLDFFKSTFKSTQHIIGSHVVSVDGNTATCVSNFQAHHTYLDAKKGTWILSGVYNHDLVRVGNAWKVSKMKMTWIWENGSRPA